MELLNKIYEFVKNIWQLGTTSVLLLGIGALIGFYFRHFMARKKGKMRRLSFPRMILRKIQKIMPESLSNSMFNIFGQSFYISIVNAYVTDDIDDSGSFLDMFFKDMPTHSKSDKKSQLKGRIWLYQTDLAVFRNPVYFKHLYAQRVLKWEAVHEIRCVIPDEFFPSENSSIEELQSLKRLWQAIKDNIQPHNEEEETNIRKLFACKQSEVREKISVPKEFEDFIAEENWVLYIRGNLAGPYPAICLHRRFLTRNESIDTKHKASERITVTGHFPKDEGRQFDQFSPLVKFVTRDCMLTFEEVFTSQKLQWENLLPVASKMVEELDKRITLKEKSLKKIQS